jgi:RHS repeat-associated protein
MMVLYGESTITDSERFWSLVGRYYDPSTAQFLSIDPDVAETGQPYAYTADDPLNSTDPLGLCARHHKCPETARKPSHAKRAMPLSAKKYAGENRPLKTVLGEGGTSVDQSYGDPPCGPTNPCDTGPAFDVSGGQVLKAVGVVAGAVAALTGVGDVIDSVGLEGLGLSGDSDILSTTARVSSVVAGGADIPACVNSDRAACAGVAGGFVGGLSASLPNAAGFSPLMSTAKVGGIAFGVAGTGIDIYGLRSGQ